jgi:capsular polysaccharide biosynthesis protein
LTRLFRGIPARIWLSFVIVATVLGAVIAGAVGVIAPSGYTARVQLLVTPAPTNGTISSSDLQISQAYIPTLAELATIRPLLEKVIASSGVSIEPEQLADAVSTHVPIGTSLLDISVSNPSPGAAAALANGIADELGTFFPKEDSPTGLRLISTVVDPATPPATRDGPSLPIRAVLGGAIAMFLAISVAFLIENAGRGAQSLGRTVERVGRRPDEPIPSALSPARSQPAATSLNQASRPSPGTPRAPAPTTGQLLTTVPLPKPVIQPGPAAWPPPFAVEPPPPAAGPPAPAAGPPPAAAAVPPPAAAPSAAPRPSNTQAASRASTTRSKPASRSSRRRASEG